MTNGFLCQRRNPESLYRTTHTGELHHPPLDEFALLPGIATVHDAVGLLIEIFDDLELSFDTWIVDEFHLILRWNHWQHVHSPFLPFFAVAIWLLQLAQVAEGPCNLVAITFVIAILFCLCAKNLGDFTSDAGLLTYTYYHIRFFVRRYIDRRRCNCHRNNIVYFNFKAF